ncbi:prolyl 4-hydroxylase [Sphingobium sp. B7D2B]|uniref:prolyl hydroxylase family protein n=1 Tax=Sphingobium sp. B7D2B TaxID=2940583 RepID=UPI0022247605|nr:2OG-Fe(II) oxygenase [Sphingobium sp. B7D2B]MCW2367016.1 prolyl 4-hydroxylase [Sphingobium sp. B7D2B]
MKQNWPDDAELPSQARAEIGVRVRQRLSRNPMISRVQTERAEMFLRHGLVTPKECTELIGKIDAGCKPSKLFSGTESGYRTSSSCNLDIYDPLVVAVTKRIDALMGIEGDYGELLQGQRYYESQQYQLHCDYFPAKVHYWPAMRATGGQRCWTAMAYLCDVEAGGETQFPRLGVTIPPRTGTLLIWNNMTADGSPNYDTLHAALPVTKGAKYVVTRWYRERPWEPRNKP